MEEQHTRSVPVYSMEILAALFGNADANLRVIEEELEVLVSARDSALIISGKAENVNIAERVLQRLIDLVNKGESLDRTRIRYAIELASQGHDELIEDISKDAVAVSYKGKQIKCKTVGQRLYVEAIRQNTVTLGTGPAGTGKTYLAVAMAVTALKNKEVSRIILTRPAVEAGEKLGFLPGDLMNKVDPYLRPLYDSLYDMIGLEGYQKLVERGIIEVAPLAYMRGRTLNDAFIILDEAQNTTSEQMKMLLTRLGIGSKAVVNGDLTQVDLPEGKKSGLEHAVNILKGIKDISIINLTYRDVVRHELVQSIIKAYDKDHKDKEKGKEKDNQKRRM